MKNPTSIDDSGEGHAKAPARRKILRVIETTTKAPSIRGKTIAPRRHPELSRRHRIESEKKEPKKDLQVIFSQFVELMSKAVEQYDASACPAPAAKDAPRNYTPTAENVDIPAIKAERPNYRPEITKGKLYFNCPACLYPTAVFAQYTGKKTRCPRCFSAILTPDPITGTAGQNLENDIESVLHPEEFVAAIPRRTNFATVIPLPKLNTALSMAAAVVFFVGMIATGRLAVHKYSPNRPVAAARSQTAEAARPQASVAVLHARAEALVAQFVEEPDWFSRSRLVRDRQRVAPLMKEYYRRPHPNDILGQHEREITAVHTGFYEHLDADIQYTEVKVTVPGSGAPPSTFIVEHTPVGDCIEWESSVAHNPMPLDELLAKKGGTIQTVRVLAAQDDYFNYQYNSDRAFICLRVQFPDTPDEFAYAYRLRMTSRRPSCCATSATPR